MKRSMLIEEDTTMKTTLCVSALAAALTAVVLARSAHAADPYKDLSIQQRAMVDPCLSG